MRLTLHTDDQPPADIREDFADLTFSQSLDPQGVAGQAGGQAAG
jgi:hypothetical protein